MNPTEGQSTARHRTISVAEDAYGRLATGSTTIEELARVLPYSAIVEHRTLQRAGG